VSGHPEPLHLDTTTGADGTPCVSVRGELSHTTAPVLDEQLRALAGPGTGPADVVIDVSAVTFCDSSGLSALLAAHRRTRRRGGSVTLRGPRGTLRRILRLTGVDVLFVVEDPDDAARDGAAPAGEVPPHALDAAAGGQA
jgi:anti-sigma B factor antagonist